jgi:hypothetical protein
MNRPHLTPQISLTDFQAFYWLKKELASFCRENGLPAGGSKQEIAARIEQFLRNGSILQPESSPKRPTSGQLPETLRRDTVIGRHWRCSEPLRAFFVQEIGPQFHFNAAMRDFVRNGAGKTLQDGIEVWYASQRLPKGASEIAPQFEYNRHLREFFQTNADKTLQDAIAAWNQKKALRKE